jgi:hypothetical protein
MTREDELRSMAADHLYGDNLPGGAEVHIERLAALLARVRSEALQSACNAVNHRPHLFKCRQDGLDMLAAIRALDPKGAAGR